MAESRRQVQGILKEKGNDVCADCGQKGPEWSSYNIGVLLCTHCAGFHKSMGAHISKVKSLHLDVWSTDQLQLLKSIGNLTAAEKYEKHVPVCYRRPGPNDAHVLKEQWVRAKYERQEFIHEDRQSYLCGEKVGWLWKRGRVDGRFLPRKFVLSEVANTLKYYIKEHHKEPKAVICLSELNATFRPEKIGNLNGLQLTFVKDGSTRNIFIYSEDGKDIVDWYIAIRSAKLNRLQVAFPGANKEDLVQHVTRDFLKEGWLWKTGPRAGNAYKRRWFTLDDRKLMYLENPLDAFAKGEIFLGYHADGYLLKLGVPPGMKEQGYVFTLRTPYRSYLLGADNEEDRFQWLSILQQVIERPLTPQDNSMAVNLVRKRNTLSSPLRILKVR